MADSIRYLFEAGHRLIAKKDSLGHGKWLPWLAANADVLGFDTPRTPQLLMKAASKYEAGFAFDNDEAVQISRQIWGHNVRGTQGTGDNEWYTPEKYIAMVREVLGAIDLDPASCAYAQKTVQAATYYTKADSGLAKEWHGRVWMNPPFATELIGKFVAKLVAEFLAGRTAQAIMLTHNYTDTEWFQDAEPHASAICFPEGRVKFLNPRGKPCSPTQGQAFCYFGDDVAKFKAIFQTIGFVR
jgi:phage N-6-adenine-methyltransferase